MYRRPNKPREKSEYEEKILEINRVCRTVKGGKRFRFRALVIVGNRKGKVGLGIGKATEVAQAVAKASNSAKKNLIEVPIINETIPHSIVVSFGSARLILKPAGKGTFIVAGGAVRSVVELAGIKNILSKTFGSPNKINNAKATMEAFRKLKISTEK